MDARLDWLLLRVFHARCCYWWNDGHFGSVVEGLARIKRLLRVVGYTRSDCGCVLDQRIGESLRTRIRCGSNRDSLGAVGKPEKQERLAIANVRELFQVLDEQRIFATTTTGNDIELGRGILIVLVDQLEFFDWIQREFPHISIRRRS